jgi:hypothetical protein
MIKTNRRNKDIAIDVLRGETYQKVAIRYDITWERTRQITRKLCLFVEDVEKHDIKKFRLRANEIIPKIEAIPETKGLEQAQSEWKHGMRRTKKPKRQKKFIHTKTFVTDKFDISCGLTKKQIDFIKFAAKRAISERLPILPESVEMLLFFQGRDAWIFSWRLCAQPTIDNTVSVSLEIVVKLKKEFCDCNVRKRFKFLCQVQMGQDIYNPKISLQEVAV